VKVALYKGKSAVSLAIRWFTRSEYSHAAFLFDEPAEAAAEKLAARGFNFGPLVWHIKGSVVEAWQGGVKNSPSMSTLHSKGTHVDLFEFAAPLAWPEETQLVQVLKGQVGLPYDYRDILAFLFRKRGKPGRALFCSELVDKDCEEVGRPLFRKTEAWRVPPDWLSRSLALRQCGQAITK
jgi:hypothetical protein